MDDKSVKFNKIHVVQPARSVTKQVILGLLAFYSNLGPSMSLGFSAVSLHFLKNSLDARELSWFASVASLATPFGCFISGPVADRYGRKWAIYFVNVICFIGWLIIALACLKDYNYPMLVLGRIVTGFSTGLCSSPATVYMAEVSSCHLRAVFTTWASISFSIGVLLVYFMGFILQDALATICFLTALLPCVGFFLTMFFVPESPAWLVRKYRLDEARSNVRKIFGDEVQDSDVDKEVDELVKSKTLASEVTKKSAMKQMLRKIQYLLKPCSLKPITLILGYFFFQQFSGTFVLIFYATDIVTNAGVRFDANLAIVLIGFARLLGTLLASFLSKSIGRRPLSIFSGTGMSLCLLSLAAWNFFQKAGDTSEPSSPILPLLLFIAYFVTNAVGFLPLPFALGAELFPTKIRGTASGLVSGLGYLFNFIVVKIYPDMISAIGSKGVFFVYGCVATVGTVFVIWLLPETRGKSLKEIEELFTSSTSAKDKNSERQKKMDNEGEVDEESSLMVVREK